jgi:hypothetical protein
LTVAVCLALLPLNLYFLPAAYCHLRSFDTRCLLSGWHRREHEAVERPAVRLINAQAGADARVLMAGTAQCPGLRGRPYYAHWYGYLFHDRFARATDCEGLWQLLRGEGITHAVVVAGWQAPNQWALDDVLARYGVPVLALPSLTVYRLDPNGAAPGPGRGSPSPVHVVWGKQFGPLETAKGDPNWQAWRWCRERGGEFVLVNTSDKPVPVSLRMILCPCGPTPKRVSLSGAAEASWELTNSGATVSEVVTVPPGRHSYFLTSTGEPGRFPGAEYWFRVERFSAEPARHL